MDNNKMEQMMRETMHSYADGLTAPDRLKTRIDVALASGETHRVRRPWGKRMVAACLVAAVMVTGAVAATSLAGIGGHSWNNERMTYAEACADLAEGGKLPEAFSNGFAYKNAVHVYSEATGEEGDTLGEWVEIDAEYRRDGASLSLSVSETNAGDFFEEKFPADAAREVDGVSIRYREYTYKAVPPAYEPTAEEQAAVNEGALQIGYGANEITEQTAQTVSWAQDGVKYSIFGFDLDMTEEELFAMAQEVIES